MRTLVFILLAGLAGSVLAQDKKPDTPKSDTPVRVRGTLPANWRKLGLTDEQRQKILAAQAEYQGQIDKLQKEIKELQKKQRAAMEAVLTTAQKERLRELATEKLPKTGEDKKPDAKPTNPK